MAHQSNALLASPSPHPVSPPSAIHRRSRSCARQCERSICTCITYFPLLFVYGLTTWAMVVQANIGFYPVPGLWPGRGIAIVGIFFWAMLNWSYTTAVFTDPGSPLGGYDLAGKAGGKRGDYAPLPTTNPTAYETNDTDISSLTVKSTGEMRYCKKCRTRKPDRAHHCSSCKRCVLKMDHHCPWLATCVGHRNYKSFILFLIYTCLLCGECFAVSAAWVWSEIVDDTARKRVGDNQRFGAVNYILLAVLAGIIGLVLTGFTGWHFYLAACGKTTIESLESTRYLSTLKRNASHNAFSGPRRLRQEQQRHYVDQEAQAQHSNFAVDSPSPLRHLTEQIKDIHANALPGVTRPEEGIETNSNSSYPPSHSATPPPRNTHDTSHLSPAQNSLQSNYNNLTDHNRLIGTPYYMRERAQENERYLSYLDDISNTQLPNAFDLGTKRNLLQVFGLEWYFWFLPVRNSLGDGWRWEVSEQWKEANEKLRAERAQVEHQMHGTADANSHARHAARGNFGQWNNEDAVDEDGNGLPLRPIRQHLSPSAPPPSHIQSSQEDAFGLGDSRSRSGSRQPARPSDLRQDGNWNDVPDDWWSERKGKRK